MQKYLEHKENVEHGENVVPVKRKGESKRSALNVI